MVSSACCISEAVVMMPSCASTLSRNLSLSCRTRDRFARRRRSTGSRSSRQCVTVFASRRSLFLAWDCEEIVACAASWVGVSSACCISRAFSVEAPFCASIRACQALLSRCRLYKFCLRRRRCTGSFSSRQFTKVAVSARRRPLTILPNGVPVCAALEAGATLSSSCDSTRGFINWDCDTPSDAECGPSSMFVSNFDICGVVSALLPVVDPEGCSVPGFYAVISRQSSKTPISTS